jgi:cytochrome c-type biogenesis protein CcmH/NrfG
MTYRPKRYLSLALLGAVLIVAACFLRARLESRLTPLEQQKAAIARLEQAAAARPNDAASCYQLAEAYARAGRVADARRSYERLCLLDSHNPQAWLALGTFEQQRGRVGAAAFAYERAVEAAPSNVEPLCALAELELRRNRVERAAQLAERALKLDPRAGCPHLVKGRVLLRSAAPEVAIPYFQRAVELEPDLLPGWVALAGWQLFVKRLDEAEAACAAGLRLDPNNPDLLALLADVKMQRASPVDVEEAARLAERALRAKPDHPEGQYVLGVIALRSNHVPEAIRHLEAALAADGSRLDARSNLVKAYRRAGRQAEAETQLKLLDIGLEYTRKVNVLLIRAQARPRDPDLHWQLAELYRSVGAREKAIREYGRVLELDPKRQSARAALERLEASSR